MKMYLWLVPLLVLLTACPPDSPPEVPVATPTGLTALSGDKQVTLAWQASDIKDLKSYLITTESVGEAAETVAVTAPATGTLIKGLNNNQDYSFKIAAETKSGKRSENSAPVVVTPKAPTTGGGAGGATKVAIPTGFSASAGNAQVTLIWTANSEPDLKGYTLYWGTQPSALSENKVVNAGTASAEVASLNNDITYFFALEAENTKGEKSERSNIVAVTPTTLITQPLIESFEIEDNGESLQIRQGLRFRLLIKGQRLAGVTSAAIGDLAATIATNTDTELVLELLTPHGHALELLDLSVTTASGTATKTRVIEVTEIHTATVTSASPDDNNVGTEERPFRTLTQALSVAGSGDTIFLGVGIYSQGETWPQEQGGFPPNITPNVPVGVTIVGQVKDKVSIEGLGKSAAVDRGASALVFAGNATVRNLTISEFNRALVHVYNPDEQCCDGSITLENLEVSNNHDGFLGYQTDSLTVRNSNFNKNTTGSGIFVGPNTDTSISDTVLSGNSYGLYTEGGRSLVLSKVTSEKNSQDGFRIGDYQVADLSGVKALSNAGDGIEVYNSEGAFRMRSSEIVANKGTGITLTGASFFPASIDLGSYAGTPQDLGNNTIGNNTNWQLYDNREANTGITIRAEGNIIGSAGNYADTGTTTSGATGSELIRNATKIWRIEKEGNSIAF